jgi:FkbM family methyltransferase
MNEASVTTTALTLGSETRTFHYRAGTSDEGVIGQIFRTVDYDLSRLRRMPDLTRYLAEGAASGRRPLVIDAGANIGASPVYFASAFPGARVVAIEPDDDNFELLKKNIEGLDVVSIHGAVASASGRARLTDPGAGHWGFRAERTAETDGPMVACVSVNDLYVQHMGDAFPFVVKIDIEGAEGEVFSANTEWVARTPVVIVELHDWLLPKQGTSQSFLRCISALDRDFIHIGENIFSIANDLSTMW